MSIWFHLKFDKYFNKYKLPKISKFNKKYLNKIDIVFSALPNGDAQKISKFLSDKQKLIDLSGDFRLLNHNDYKKWYKIKHKAPKKIKDSKQIHILANINFLYL